MAYGESFTPRSSSGEIKVRGPVWVGVFSLVTLGIYSIYWIYVTAKHLRDYGNANGRDLGQKPGMTLLAITFGWLLLFIPPLVAIYRQARRIQQAQHIAGVQPMNGWLALVLYLVLSPVFFAYEQSELNKVWAREGGPVPDDSSSYEAARLPEAPATSAETLRSPEAVETAPPPSPERPPQ
jgi:Domain of unknown function (DUF4234)